MFWENRNSNACEIDKRQTHFLQNTFQQVAGNTCTILHTKRLLAYFVTLTSMHYSIANNNAVLCVPPKITKTSSDGQQFAKTTETDCQLRTASAIQLNLF
jgi:hypothetical protein